MNDVTRLLQAVQEGDASANEQLLHVVYHELRALARAKMAAEPAGHTLQATALVHEAWLRLGDARFENRAHFFAAAAEAMRRILIDRARRKHTHKRGAGAEHIPAGEIDLPAPDGKAEELLAVNEALDALAEHDARKAELVKLRYFVGLSIPEAAEVLGISEATAKRDWTYARAWLFLAITKESSGTPDKPA